MSRGMIDDSDWELYGQMLPDLTELGELVYQIPTPDFLSISTTHGKTYDSWFPVASQCFRESYEALWGAHYALREIFAHNIWYLKKKDPPNEDAAALFGRFYADDAILRLYSAGEHLANGIIMMLDIPDEELKSFRIKGHQGNEKSSQQIVVGRYLCSKGEGYPFTEAIINLSKSEDWGKVLKYRNDWVHEQPPTIKGLGIVYKRERRWKHSSDGKNCMFLGGDTPEYSVEELASFIQPGMLQFIAAFTSILKYYKSKSESNVANFNNLSSRKK